MKQNVKQIELLQINDFIRNPVWEFVNDDSRGETSVQPVETIPVADLKQKIVGLQVKLANGTQVWAMVFNADVRNPRSTEQFLTVSIEMNQRWFCLARYHDIDFEKRGPDALARFLGLSVDEVFPISYNLSGLSAGISAALIGKITKEPRERLSQAELIAMVIS